MGMGHPNERGVCVHAKTPGLHLAQPKVLFVSGQDSHTGWTSVFLCVR